MNQSIESHILGKQKIEWFSPHHPWEQEEGDSGRWGFKLFDIDDRGEEQDWF
jgi:hypothetical protein